MAFGLWGSGSSSVVTYTVHEKPDPAPDRLDRGDALLFIKDGFSWLTALFPPLGFISKSLWLATFLYLVVVSAIVVGLTHISFDPTWTSILVTALNIYLAFEISSIERWSLERAGWRMLGVVTGRNLADCERRFMESWLPSQPMIATVGEDHESLSALANKSRFLTSRPWPFPAQS